MKIKTVKGDWMRGGKGVKQFHVASAMKSKVSTWVVGCSMMGLFMVKNIAKVLLEINVVIREGSSVTATATENSLQQHWSNDVRRTETTKKNVWQSRLW